MVHDPFRGSTTAVHASQPSTLTVDTVRSMRELVAAFPAPPPTIGSCSLGRSFASASGPFRIVEDVHLVDTVEDWSGVRAPSRAARRRRQGHRQRIRYITEPKPGIYQIGDMLIMHPATASKLRAQLKLAGVSLMRSIEAEMMNLFCRPGA